VITEILKIETNQPSDLRQAIHRVTLNIAVKGRRVSRSTHQVPIEIGSGMCHRGKCVHEFLVIVGKVCIIW
jgi:hypothetical protein